MNNQKCTIDLAAPGAGPMRFFLPHTSVENVKYETFDLSLKSKSDLNLNPQPEGAMKGRGLPTNRHGVYVIDTDRGELSATIETPVNMRKTVKMPTSQLQDFVKPTTKDTLLHSYEGYVAPITAKEAQYSQYMPTYKQVTDNSGKTFNMRTSGSQNYSLKTAVEYSRFNGVQITGLNNSVVQNPDNVVRNLYKRPDKNINGPGTLEKALPNGSRFQDYKLIEKPTTNGLRVNTNLETDAAELHQTSLLLGKKVNGIENRYTASYQIAPLLSNPLHAIWNPEDKGEIPAFFTNSKQEDFSFATSTDQLPPDELVPGGSNNSWVRDDTKDSNNSYILGMANGIHNKRIEWAYEVNNKPGHVYDSQNITPGKSYSGTRSIQDMYMNSIRPSMKNYDDIVRNDYITYGDPDAGFVKGY